MPSTQEMRKAATYHRQLCNTRQHLHVQHSRLIVRSRVLRYIQAETNLRTAWHSFQNPSISLENYSFD
jgi:hypothetical protein